MELKLYSNDFEHIKGMSNYNHNYYENKDDHTLIYEHCDENYDTYEYYLIDGENKVFLGSSREALGYSETVNIDFRMKYT